MVGTKMSTLQNLMNLHKKKEQEKQKETRIYGRMEVVDFLTEKFHEMKTPDQFCDFFFNFSKNPNEFLKDLDD